MRRWVLAFHAALIGTGKDIRWDNSNKAMPVEPQLAAAWLRTWPAQPVLNGDLGVDAFFTRALH